MSVAVFGPTSVGGAGSLSGRDRRVLAALVAESPRACSADRLASALYGGNPPPTWRKVVQGCVGRLRRVLGAHAIATLPDGYRLELGDDEIDVRRFERLLNKAEELSAVGEPERAALTLSEAMRLVTGEPFADLDGWAAAGARYAELVRSAEERLVSALLASAQYAAALAKAAEAVESEPLREQRWAALALAQYRTGRQGEALRTINRARRVLADELGLNLGAELVDLEAAILDQDPSLAGAVPAHSYGMGTCPYRGLAAYGVDDAEWFFGRDTDIDRCLGIVAATGFLAIVGASGSGKSSLARAGVAPRLARPGRAPAVVTPGAEPDRALAGVARGSLLVVDQLEELFVLCDDPAARTRFAAAVVRWSATAPVIVTLRADHLADVAEHTDLTTRIQGGIYLLGAMGEPQLRAAIEAPAAKAGLRLEPGLVDLLVRDVAGEPGALPLLSHALAETWQHREGPVLTTTGYRAVGGVQGAVARAADQVIDSLPPQGRKAARDLFLRLVVSTDTDPIRKRIPRSALAADPVTEAVLDALVQSRLVISDQYTFEVAHEAIARAWPRLRAWLDEDRDGIRLHQHLTQAAAEWGHRGRDTDDLYRGPRLVAALDWVDRTQPDLNRTERDFLSQSTAGRDREALRAAETVHRQRRANRRLRATLAAAGVLLVATVTGAAVATRQADRADRQAGLADQRNIEADASRLAAQSTQLQDGQLPLAQLLAVEAHRLNPNPNTHSALLHAVHGIPALRGYIIGPRPHFGLALDADGTTAYTSSGSGTSIGDANGVAVFDLVDRTSERTVDLEVLGSLQDLVITPDGSTMVACDEERLVFFDPDSFRPIGQPIAIETECKLAASADSSAVAVSTIEFLRVFRVSDHSRLGPAIANVGNDSTPPALSPDGRLVAYPLSHSALESNVAQQWVVETGQPLGPPIEPPQPVSTDRFLNSATVESVAYSPDGQLFLVGDSSGQVRVFSARDQQPVGLPVDIGDERVAAIAFSPDGDRIALGSGVGEMQLFDASTRLPLTPSMAGQGKYIFGLAFTADGNTVVASSGEGTIALYDAAARPVAGHILGEGAGTPDQQVIQVAMRSDGHLAATSHVDGSVKVWNLDTGQKVSPDLRVPAEAVAVGIAFSPDGSRLAAGDLAGNVIVWNTETWTQAGPPITVPGEGLLVRIAFSPDGTVLAAGRQFPPTIGFYDVATHRQIGDLLRPPLVDPTPDDVYPLHGLSFSPDGSLLATTAETDGGVQVWDAATRRLALTITGLQRDAIDAAFDPAGTQLAVAQTGGVVEVFDLATGDRDGEPLQGLQSNAIDLQYSRDGTMLAATSLAGTVRLWDTATGLP
ncbi:MAG TPA: BTAD domain-containing putative transcriptional regulator, partial [Acidimicrobiia bacterium]|nr:BTAD domain-containing putative transcriptional regulator [Acidimicrobiia bacterium]